MHKLPEYIKYNNEKDIALLDNSSIAFLEQLKHHGVDSASLLSSYDVILIPDWVLEEMCDSSYRESYLNDLVDAGFPIYRISEQSYSELADGEEINLFHIVKAAVSQEAYLRSYLHKNVEKPDLLDEVFSWYYPIITSVTVMTQDADAHSFITKAQEQLVAVFPDKHPITVTYKSNDFVLCELFRSGCIQLSDISTLRKDARKVTYTQQRPDKSTALITEKLDNAAFERLIQDETASIIF